MQSKIGKIDANCCRSFYEHLKVHIITFLHIYIFQPIRTNKQSTAPRNTGTIAKIIYKRRHTLKHTIKYYNHIFMKFLDKILIYIPARVFSISHNLYTLKIFCLTNICFSFYFVLKCQKMKHNKEFQL